MKTIIEDTRQKTEKHAMKHSDWSNDGVRIFRNKLIVGDYALPPTVSIDTKQDISEIAGNICGGLNERKRFIRECKIARDIGCKLIVLVEDKRFHAVTDLFGRDVWILSNPKRKIKGDQLATAMMMISERYGVEFRFCDPHDAANEIYELLVKGDGTK